MPYGLCEVSHVVSLGVRGSGLGFRVSGFGVRGSGSGFGGDWRFPLPFLTKPSRVMGSRTKSLAERRAESV